MKIYSIKEIVQATNNFYNSKPKSSINKVKLPSETESIIKEAEKSITPPKKNFKKEEKTLVLNNEISDESDNKINPLNYKIKIKPEVKDHMINELYLYLKKKVRKNTLKIIVEEQQEIKNLKNEIIFLKKIKDELTNNYQILKNNELKVKLNYESALKINKELKVTNKKLQDDLSEVTKNKENLYIENNELKNNELKVKLNYESALKISKELKVTNKKLQDDLVTVTNYKESLDSENKKLKNDYESSIKISKELKTNNKKLQDNLSTITKNKESLDKKNNELKNNYETTIKISKELKTNNKKLQDDLSVTTKNKESLDKRNKQLKIKLKETSKNLNDSIEKNRSFEINNAEIKNTLSRYIVNYKKLQEKISLVKDSKDLKFEKEIQKVKFYQDENARLSSELLSMQKRNDIFKENFKNIEMEKEKISSKIKDLNKSIEEKSNVISSPIIKSSSEEAKKDIEKLNDKEQKSLDEAINRIFAKI